MWKVSNKKDFLKTALKVLPSLTGLVCMSVLPVADTRMTP